MAERNVLGMAGRTLSASLVMGLVVYGVASALKTLPAPLILIIAAGVGAAVFEVVALAFGLPEARTVPGTVLRRFRR